MKAGFLKISLPLVATVLVFLFTVVNLSAPFSFADGDGSDGFCSTTAQSIDPSDNGGSTFSTNFNAGSGNVVNGVCIKSGSNMFGGNKHSSLITTNGTIENGCYTISGIGTQFLTVTRNFSGSNCQGISHLDINVGGQATPTPTPTPTPSVSPSPSVSPTPTPRVTPSPTPSSTPSPTSTPSPSVSPSPTPTPSASPTPSPTPTATPSATPTPTPTPCGGTCGGGNTQNQSQEQHNNQTVNITVNGQVAGAKIPAISPETGVSVLGMSMLLGGAPLGFAIRKLAKKGKDLSEIASEVHKNKNGEYN